MKKNYVLNALFATSLIVLFINDFLLKEAFHNGITGKLSDVSGLIVFVLFFLVFFESRRLLVFAGTAVFFAWWKSPLSQGAIDAWNAWPFVDLHRTVDYTDLFCLSVFVPLWYFRPTESKGWTPLVRKWSYYPLAAVTVFMFFATSRMPYHYAERMGIDKDVKSSLDRAAIKQRLEEQHVLIPTGGVVWGKDTLESYIIENLVIESDTIPKTCIGLEDRRKGGTIYVSYIEFGKEGLMVASSAYKSTRKGYQELLTNYFSTTVGD